MHAVIAFSALPLCLGALLSDWAYATSHQVQWTNFAAWLVAGSLPLAGLALLWGALDTWRAGAARHRLGTAYVVLLLAAFVLGVFNALVHARDGWAVMPTGPALSAVVLILAAAASVIGLMAWRRAA